MNNSPNRQQIEDWLITEISTRLKVPLEEIDVAAPLSQFGLGSSDGVALQADLEIWLDRELPPTMVWDYPTIREVAHYLAPDR